MDFFHGRAGSQIEGVAEVRVFPPSAERDEPRILLGIALLII